MLDNRFNKKKYHFFIGNVFTNPSDYKLINKILHNLRLPKDPSKKLKKLHWNNRFFTNLIYIGFLEERIAKEYMDNIFNNLLEELVSRIGILECKYNDFIIKSDGSYNRVSIRFNDLQNILEKIIVPYLHKNGILPIYPNKKYILKPTIDIFHYKDNVTIDEQTIDEIKKLLNNESFKMDHISLIKGDPIDIRAGTASIHDRMNIEEVDGYRFNFRNNTQNNTQRNTKNNTGNNTRNNTRNNISLNTNKNKNKESWGLF